jgi:hypothetical protein
MNDAREVLAREAADPQHGLWWLSFVDTSRPEGDRFLGVCIVEAVGPVSAVGVAHARGCNPGGEVGITGPAPLELWPSDLRNRLLTREEAEGL